MASEEPKVEAAEQPAAPAEKAQTPAPAPTGPAEDIRFLEASALKLKRVGSHLHLQGPDDEEWRQVGLVHLFPLTETEAWISVLDKEGKEIGILQTLAGLPVEAVEWVRDELRRRYAVPQIRRVLSRRQRFDLTEWKVETDRGPAALVTRNLRDQVQQPRPNHYTITDVEGNRYDIPNLLELDPASRRLLESHL